MRPGARCTLERSEIRTETACSESAYACRRSVGTSATPPRAKMRTALKRGSMHAGAPPTAQRVGLLVGTFERNHGGHCRRRGQCPLSVRGTTLPGGGTTAGAGKAIFPLLGRYRRVVTFYGIRLCPGVRSRGAVLRVRPGERRVGLRNCEMGA